MPVEIRSYDDLVRETKRAIVHYEDMRRRRIGEILDSIDRAVLQGASGIATVIEALSDREKADLLDHFPNFLVSLQAATSVDHLLVITRGARALYRSAPPLDGKQKLDPSSADMARRAFAYTKAPLTERAKMLRDLERVEANADSFWGLLGIWMRVKASYFKKIARRFLSRRAM